MINYIWGAMLISGFVAAAAEGRLEKITKAVLTGATDAISLAIGLVSILVFWLGIMKIAEESGMLNKVARLLYPLAKWLFPSVPKGHPAMGYIISNLSVNLLGVGNAATPLGIKAMEELQKLNPNPKTATPAMCTLLAINTSGVTLVPTLVIGLRIKYGSANPTEIIGPTLLATILATGAAILIDRYYHNKHLKNEGK